MEGIRVYYIITLPDFDLNQNAAHIIESVVEVAENAAQCHEHRLAIRAHLPDFARFVNHIMMRYRPTIGAVFVCGVYLGRAKKTLEILQWSKSACECILLGAVILASKVRKLCLLISTPGFLHTLFTVRERQKLQQRGMGIVLQPFHLSRHQYNRAAVSRCTQLRIKFHRRRYCYA